MERTEIRLNKYLSDSGVCSRREADRLIQQGLVHINGQPVQMGQRVTSGDLVTVKGKPIHPADEKIYLLFHKPRGIECTEQKKVKNNIIQYLNYPVRITHAGRLDKYSEGLMLMTNDGDLINNMMRARNGHEKEYLVTVDKPITEDFLKGMAQGVPILDTITRPCTITQTGKYTFRIILTQGLNRQIRRMCEYFHYKVTKLKRVRILNLELGSLPLGKSRPATDEELTQLFKLLEQEP